MAAIECSHLLLVILLYLNTSITLSVNITPGPDGINRVSSTSSLLNQKVLGKLSTPSSTIDHSVDNGNNKEISKNYLSTSVMSEGGPISLSKTTLPQNINIKINKSEIEGNISKEKNAILSVIDKKEDKENKVKSRKGVENLDMEQTTVPFGKSNHKSTKFITENVSVMETVHANNQIKTSTPKLNVTNLHFANNSDVNSSSAFTTSNIIASHTEVTTNRTISKSSIHIPKPKPTVTTIGKMDEINKSRSFSQTKTSSIGMPRKIDYIIPVVITMIALPLLSIAAFVLYKRGRDCWDKRHYRRMDFLIDGMYND